MKLLYLTVVFIFTQVFLYANDNNYGSEDISETYITNKATKPQYINALHNENINFNSFKGIDGERTYEQFHDNIKEEKLFFKDDKLLKLYNENKRPTFVIFYNRVIDNLMNQPSVKVTIPTNKMNNSTLLKTIYLPINRMRHTTFENEQWKIEKYINEYFNTNNMRSVDQNILTRLGKVNAYKDDSIREIEIKGLSKGADFIFEILFAHNLDFRIKVISLETGEILFSDYSPINTNKSKFILSKNNDFYNKTKKINFNTRLKTSLDKLNTSLISYFENIKLNKNTASDRLEKQDKALQTDSFKRKLIPKDFDKDKNQDQDQTATGTGFFVGSNGFIITNHHVVANAEEIKVEYDTKRYTAKVLEKDPINDIALLQIDLSNAPRLTLGHDVIKKGMTVCALGYPLTFLQGKELKTTFGNINSLSGFKSDTRFLQIDTPIQPGNSGGPLVDMKGNVVGIVTSKLNQETTYKTTGNFSQNVNYALNINYVLPILKKHNIALGLASNISLENTKLIGSISKSVVFIESKIK